MEAEFITEGDQTRLQLRSVESDGTPRNFFDTTAGITNPDFMVTEHRLDQVAPGVYETDLGTLSPGAYALRFVQTKPGETPLARTVMLIAPTPAEYRLLGTNERLLAALQSATGGKAVEDPADVWKHDLGTTTASTELLPWLLLLALLLWPVDVAVRRVSISRGDVGLARAWTAARWRAWRGPARRPEKVGEMLAAKGRAGGAQSRAALFRSPGKSDAPPATPDKPKPPAKTATSAPPAAATPAAPPAAPPAAKAAPEPPAQPEVDTLARLREAQQRRRDRG